MIDATYPESYEFVRASIAIEDAPGYRRILLAGTNTLLGKHYREGSTHIFTSGDDVRDYSNSDYYEGLCQFFHAETQRREDRLREAQRPKRKYTSSGLPKKTKRFYSGKSPGSSKSALAQLVGKEQHKSGIILDRPAIRNARQCAMYLGTKTGKTVSMSALLRWALARAAEGIPGGKAK